MPTTDIPPPGRAAGTASRCGPLPRALRLLREKQRREAPRSLSVRESRAGASELRRWSRPPAPRRACRAASARPAASSPLRFAAPNRQLLRSAPARSAPGGASLRSAAARRPRPRPLPSALGNGSLRSGGFEKELGKGEAAEPRGGAGRAVARRQARPSGLRATAGSGGGGGGQRTRLSGARLSARPPASPRRRNPQHRPPVRPHPPAVPKSRGLIAHPPASSPRGAHVRLAPGTSSSLSVRWSPLCGARATPAS